MTVAELIERLKQFPSDTLVLGRGYESGYDAIGMVHMAGVVHHPNNAWYEGEYETPWNDDEKPTHTAVIISSGNRT